MRPLVRAGAIVGFLGLIVAVAATGSTIAPQPVTLDDVSIEDATGATSIIDDEPPAEPKPASPGAEELERVEPREPLSELSLALPPKPAPPDEWEGTILYRPVARSAGLIEAMGYSVAISGIDIVAADETCPGEGRRWDCGIAARTAFRSFLRGRAPSCIVPPKPDRQVIVAACRVGKQDVGAWLISNGWARAAEGGAYVEAEEQARKAERGVFGAAPTRGGLDKLLPAGPLVDVTPPADPTGPFQ